jgi:quinoprotein glucose dehydrogenase
VATASDVDSRRQLIEAVRLLDAKELLADVRAVALSDQETSAVRVEALKTLAALKDSSLREAVAKALASKNANLRAEARRHLATLDPAAAVPALEGVIVSGSRAERQAALATLATIAAPTAEAVLVKGMEQLKEGRFPKEAELDLLLAAEAKGSPALKSQLQALADSRDKKDPLAEYRSCLEGGDPHRGKRIFETKTEVYCLRCHKVGSSGGEVGPNLADIGKKKDRTYILESIVTPNAKIAEGFESVIVELEDGRTLAGVLKAETPTEIRIITADAKNIVIDKKQIAERRRGPSAMPADVMKHLSKRELRDLVEFLVVQPKTESQ